MKSEIDLVVQHYLSGISKDAFHRYLSWDHCFSAFTGKEPCDKPALELAFYLASWGMYRGSSGLLQRNYKIHERAIEILNTKTALSLKCNENNEVSKSQISDILNVKNQLADYYYNVYFSNEIEGPKRINPTDTLISKIMLGTLGCTPAYDTYLIKGLKEYSLIHSSFDELSLIELFDFIENNQYEISLAQQEIKIKIDKHYPVMKILDILFWQSGYDKEIESKKAKLEANKDSV